MKWIKPSGLEIETNNEKATIEYCESLGWVCEIEEPEEPTGTEAVDAMPEIEESKDDSFSSNAATSGAITQDTECQPEQN